MSSASPRRCSNRCLDCRCRFDQLAAPTQYLVTKLYDPQVRPCAWTDPQDFGGNRLGGKRRLRLCQEHCECGRRARKPGVTVDEQMLVLSGARQKISSEMQELTNVLRFGRAHTPILADNIVKAQLQPLILGKRTKLGRHGRVRIEERKHMAGANTTLSRQLREAADRDPDREYVRHCLCNAIRRAEFLLAAGLLMVRLCR